ncbi:hypothetical protein BVU_3375 [Phocaeicola vulgatus ATCC 8482]|uniref:Uncharacterized protein n=1 Tax=Phocaeicola vulgatus (strain ATCC 8482 / DSM 1447 / JCM 5826 / CCUG 4940 / NBRC 14291 / NCTC 11154) TaxID=435590 RepID=A6L5N7_PHOV8|nr:hypothetical protein BVU_3375 [Phocaeicola vulgatus ATCC 8482]
MPSKQSNKILYRISFVPLIDDTIHNLVLHVGVEYFPDVVGLPAAVGDEKAVEVRIVHDVAGLVNGGFEGHHQVQFLVHGGFHQVDAQSGHGSVELVAVLHFPGYRHVGIGIVPSHKGLLLDMLEGVGGKVLVLLDQYVERVGGGGNGSGQHQVGMGIAYLGVQRGPHLVELVGAFRDHGLLPEAGGHSAQCLVLVLLDALVQGYQGFDGGQVLGYDHGIAHI